MEGGIIQYSKIRENQFYFPTVGGGGGIREKGLGGRREGIKFETLPGIPPLQELSPPFIYLFHLSLLSTVSLLSLLSLLYCISFMSFISPLLYLFAVLYLSFYIMYLFYLTRALSSLCIPLPSPIHILYCISLHLSIISLYLFSFYIYLLISILNLFSSV